MVTVGAGLLSVLVIGSLSIWTIIQTGDTAYAAGSETLEAQTRNYMLGLATVTAGQLDLQLEQARKDATLVSAYTAEILSSSDALPGGSLWSVDDDLIQQESGAWVNSVLDASSAFVPSHVDLNAANRDALEQLALLDLVFPSMYGADPNSAAVWVTLETGMVWYHPNIGLGDLVPPDLRAQDDATFFVPAAPGQNPDRKAVWSDVYDDPAGLGLMTTASAPIYVDDEFRGVAGIDVTLALLTQRIEALEPVEGGYAFLVDASGRALALPDAAYQDMLGRPRQQGEFGPDAASSDSRFAPIVDQMISGSAGFDSATVDDATMLVAFAPLADTGWSVAVVGDRDVVLKVVADLRSELDSSTGLLIWQRVVPAGIAILLTAVLLALWSTRRLVDPIRRLAIASEGLAAGEWDQELPPAGHDEIGVLSKSFSSMADELRRTMDGLERRVEERTRELEIAREEADAANNAKSTFLANMSHELRTPMNAVIGYSEMLAEDAEYEGHEDIIPDLHKISAAGNHLLSLINNILDLSKIESGGMELFLETFELQTLLDDSVTTLEPLVAKNENRLVTDYDDDLGDMTADATKVRQSLFNLVSNASKFSSEGTITLTARRYSLDGQERIRLDVIDTGIGIPEDKLDKVFEEFGQADASTTRNYGGTGLGLPISRKICQMMGGDITVSSEVGVGSTFTIDLPAVVSVEAAVEEEDPGEGAGIVEADVEEASAAADAARGLILIIDDDPNARELLTRTLERAGHVVVSARSAEEGLELARQTSPGLITLDVNLPGIDGWEALSVIKADEALRGIPVVMVSAEGDEAKASDAKAVDSLTKPVDRRVLLGIVRRHVTVENSLVLVVEDDPDIAELIRRSLTEAGFRATVARNGAEGLDRISDELPDLILTDLMMPVMDGFEFVSTVRAQPRYVEIPIVVVTAKDLTADERARLDGAVESVIEKNRGWEEKLLGRIAEVDVGSSTDQVGAD
jgi:signal transduction histidine kinase/DNA-binding response OmpR family regulator